MLGSNLLEHSQGVYWYVPSKPCRIGLMLVPISDTDQLRETCAGMFGGDEAFIEGM